MVKSINKDKNKERVDGDKIEKKGCFLFLNYIFKLYFRLYDAAGIFLKLNTE